MTESNIQSEQLSLSLLAKKYERIVIPILQRDYAQGRKYEEELRTNFLNQLKSFLLSKKSYNDLDFVYGNIEYNPLRFIPLDGQQRLTTLFLLHYYLSIHDGVFNQFQATFGYKEPEDTLFKSRFTYETRNSSVDFCNALLNNPVDLNNLSEPDYFKDVSLKNEFSNTLNNYGWFINSWTFDPTIDSMLRMLDSIHEAFKDCNNGFYAKLISEDSPSITFRELPMRDNGLNEDLYVKMNSRGLPLTRFEKIKAKIIQTLKESKQHRKLSRTSTEQEKDTTVADYFSYKIDTVWSHMFWPYRSEKTIKKKVGEIEESYTLKEIDSRLLNFIAAIASNYQASKLGVKNLDVALMDSAPKSSWASFSKFDSNFFIHLIDVFDAFNRDYDSNGIIIYTDNLAFDIKKVFESLVTNAYTVRSYKERIWLYAYYMFLIQYKNKLTDTCIKNEMKDWCRVVMNLTENNRYDDEADYCNTISFISYLLENSIDKGILKLLSSKEDIPSKGVDQRQFKEERIKAWAIVHGGEEWRETIIYSEQNAYLTGQIISIIYLSGLEDCYDKYYDSTYYDESSFFDNNLLQNFKQYTNYINELFVKDRLNPKYEKNQLFRRALLAKGNYTMMANSNQSLLNNTSRDISWKRYLHQTPEHLRQLSDLLAPNITNLEQYFLSVINGRGVNNLNDWIGILINTPQIWSFMDWNNDNSNRYIRFSEEQGYKQGIYPLKLQRMNGEHSEIRILYKHSQLMKNSLFSSYNIHVKNTAGYDEPYIKISNGTIQFCIYYNYQQQYPWRIEIWKDDETEIPDSVIQKATQFGFIADSDESNKIYHLKKDETDNDLEGELTNFVSNGFFC